MYKDSKEAGLQVRVFSYLHASSLWPYCKCLIFKDKIRLS